MSGQASPIPAQAMILDTSRPPLWKIVRLAWPVTFSMLFHTSYAVVDVYWVARLGSDAVAAVTLSSVIFWVGFSISQIFAGGVHALVARFYGAGRRDRAGVVLRDGLVAALLAGGLYAGGVALAAEPLLARLGAEARVAALGAPYVAVSALGVMIAAALFTLVSAFRATGDMITPLVLTGLSCGLNIVLDPLFIFGAGPVTGMGLVGAAWASFCAICFAFALGLGIVLWPKRSPLRLPLRARPNVQALRDMLAVGVPSGAHYLLLSVSHMVMIRLVARFGSLPLAATGIGGRLIQFSFLPCMGIGAATATLVGQFLGARKPGEAERAVGAAFRLNLAVTGAITLVYLLLPRLLLRPFATDPALLPLGTVYLRIFGVSFLFVSMTITLTRVFQGAGDTVWPTAVALVRLGLVVGLALLLDRVMGFGVYGVWSAMLASAVVQFGIVAWLYTLGTWKRRQLASVDLEEVGAEVDVEPPAAD